MAQDERPEVFVVTEDAEGERLDRLLAARGPHSRAVYQRWIKSGQVRLDGSIAEVDARPRAGQAVEVTPGPLAEALRAKPQPIPIDVIYEDQDIVVVDKPAFMVVHPAPGHPAGTLVNALLHRFGSLPGAADERPGIVHRIDALTSGVMVVARSETAHRRLVEMFAAHRLTRAYHAIATGHPPATLAFDTLYGRHPRDRKRFSSKVERGKRARTHVETVEYLHGAALVRCTLETGRTHQIRVHLCDRGHPLLGDPMYGRPPRDPHLRAAAAKLKRQALHAALLAFEHPRSGELLRFESPPPEDFQAALLALRSDEKRQ